MKIKEEQTRRSKIGFDKMNILKIEDNYKWKSMKNTNVEFYLEKGFSEQEAILKRKERQKTFSKDICIEKWGSERGIAIWEKRQEKWLNSISKSNFDFKLKNCKSSNYLKNKFGEDWLIMSAIIQRRRFNIKMSKYINDFCENIVNNKQIVSIREINWIFKSNLLKDYFNITTKELKDKLINKYGIIRGKYGNIRYFNNHICRSNGEYYIANELKKLNIEYIYEKRYPNSN